jgi:CHAT domain-containing protein
MSEVAMLKLNADFVVLSACNTAAGDKPGAEALSGLARAFFYAGAKSLVVSHWEVDSEATVALMGGLFAALKANPNLSHAEALRLSMLRMIGDSSKPDWAQPSFWAPFVIVGEPNRKIRQSPSFGRSGTITITHVAPIRLLTKPNERATSPRGVGAEGCSCLELA